jgi:hypothetical protein
MAITAPTFLPELYLPSRANVHCYETGIDSFELCLDRTHYLSYPHKVEYHHNSRGFRDSEWPDNLSDVIWCVGDSFTVGLGSPAEHTWPYILQQRTRRRTINVSLDGASNNWIARLGSAILTEYPDAIIVAQWSFLHRRELTVEEVLEKRFSEFYKMVADPTWPACNNLNDFKNLPVWIQEEIIQIHNWPGPNSAGEYRRVFEVDSTPEEDIVNTQSCIQQLYGNVVHSAIPNWAPPGTNLNYGNIILTEQLDYARDRYHYDIVTSNSLVDKIIPALSLNASL